MPLETGIRRKKKKFLGRQTSGITRLVLLLIRKVIPEKGIKVCLLAYLPLIKNKIKRIVFVCGLLARIKREAEDVVGQYRWSSGCASWIFPEV